MRFLGNTLNDWDVRVILKRKSYHGIYSVYGDVLGRHNKTYRSFLVSKQVLSTGLSLPLSLAKDFYTDNRVLYKNEIKSLKQNTKLWKYLQV